MQLIQFAKNYPLATFLAGFGLVVSYGLIELLAMLETL